MARDESTELGRAQSEKTTKFDVSEPGLLGEWVELSRGIKR
jgi:hypothetical protein